MRSVVNPTGGSSGGDRQGDGTSGDGASGDGELGPGEDARIVLGAGKGLDDLDQVRPGAQCLSKTRHRRSAFPSPYRPPEVTLNVDEASAFDGEQSSFAGDQAAFVGKRASIIVPCSTDYGLATWLSCMSLLHKKSEDLGYFQDRAQDRRRSGIENDDGESCTTG